MFKKEELRKDLITKRCIDNNMTMDEACKEIGISKATLSRLEKSKIPDIETLGKICFWLKTEPNKYLYCQYADKVSIEVEKVLGIILNYNRESVRLSDLFSQVEDKSEKMVLREEIKNCEIRIDTLYRLINNEEPLCADKAAKTLKNE